MKVPWMSKEQITHAALQVLEGYETATGRSARPPIPIEDIIERYLDLNLSFEDLDNILGVKDVLGATYVKSRLIAINKSLLEDPGEGRLVFTCAHEAGHWVLHREFASEANRMMNPGGAIICRSANARMPIEWQADYFAAALLMPERELQGAFRDVCGADTLELHNVRRISSGSNGYFDPALENWPLIADAVREAGGFTNVSMQAMVIRLQDLGMLVNLTGRPIGWRNGGR
jgi:hypothetical protein